MSDTNPVQVSADLAVTEARKRVEHREKILKDERTFFTAAIERGDHVAVMSLAPKVYRAIELLNKELTALADRQLLAYLIEDDAKTRK